MQNVHTLFHVLFLFIFPHVNNGMLIMKYTTNNFKEFVQNRSKDEKLYKFLKKLLIPQIKSYPNIVFLGQGKNGIVYKIDEDTTIKIFNNINIDCPRNNKYAKFWKISKIQNRYIISCRYIINLFVNTNNLIIIQYVLSVINYY